MKKAYSFLILLVLFGGKSFALGPLDGTFGVCAGDSVDIYESDTLSSGGTWSSSNTAVATVLAFYTASAFVTGVSAGTAVITYTLGGSYVTAEVTVSPAPAAITGTSVLCPGATSTLSDAVAGGTWSSGDPSIAVVGSASGIVTGISGGVTGINYTIGSGCSAIVTFTINATYTGTITGPSTVCVGSTITLISWDTLSAGIWGSSNTSIATISTSGVVTGIAAGTDTISCTFTGICGIASATEVITVLSTTSPGTISGPAGIDIGAPGTFTESIPGGTWTIMDPSIATIGSSTGVVTGILSGTDIITYTVSGCGGTATTTAPVDILTFDGISGYVLFSGPSPYSSVKVWLIHFDPGTNMLTAIDSTIVYSTGGSAYYQFLGAATDSFRIKAAVTDTTGYGYIPTYHSNNFYWHDATVLWHTSGTADINQDINMAYGTVTSGPGFIAGNVLTGANRGTSVAIPAANLHVCIVNSASSQIIQETYTNSAGNYTFSNLPVGQTYYVFPDSLNYYTTSYSGITLTTSSPSMSEANFGQHILSKTILPVVTGIKNITPNSCSVIAFPNPASSKLNIQWNENANENGTITLTNITGREVYTSTLNMTQGTGAAQLDLSGLNSGIYMISIKSASVTYNNKIELAH